MANVKITELPSATSITPGADVLPIVSGGITTKATPDQIVSPALTAPGPIGSATPNTGAFTQVNLGDNQEIVWGAGLNNMTANDGSGYFLDTDGSFIIQQLGAGLPQGPFFALDQYGSLGLGTLFANYYGVQARCITLDGEGITEGVIDFRNQGTQTGSIDVSSTAFNINSPAGSVRIRGAQPGAIDNMAIGAALPLSAKFKNSVSVQGATGAGNGVFIGGDITDATNPQLTISTNDVANSVYLDVSAVDGTANSALLFSTGGAFKWAISPDGDLFPRQGTQAMTNGFAYIPAANGIPTGTPTGATGAVPLYYDAKDGALFAYNAGWQSVNFQPNHVEARLTSSLTINNTTDTAITWNQIDTDETQLTYSPSLRQWQNSSDRNLTVIISVTVAWPSAAGGARAVFITRNGNAATGTNRMAESDVDAGTADFDVQNVASSFSLAPGDYFQVYAWQNSGGGIDIGGAAGGMSANYSTRLQVTVL